MFPAPHPRRSRDPEGSETLWRRRTATHGRTERSIRARRRERRPEYQVRYGDPLRADSSSNFQHAFDRPPEGVMRIRQPSFRTIRLLPTGDNRFTRFLCDRRQLFRCHLQTAESSFAHDDAADRFRRRLVDREPGIRLVANPLVQAPDLGEKWSGIPFDDVRATNHEVLEGSGIETPEGGEPKLTGMIARQEHVAMLITLQREVVNHRRRAALV